MTLLVTLWGLFLFPCMPCVWLCVWAISLTHVLGVATLHPWWSFFLARCAVHLPTCVSQLRLKQQTWISHSSGGWKSKIKVSSGLVSSEVTRAGLQGATVSPSSRGRPSMGTHSWCLCVRPDSLFCPGQNRSDWIKAPPPMTSFNPNHFFKHSHSPRY